MLGKPLGILTPNLIFVLLIKMGGQFQKDVFLVGEGSGNGGDNTAPGIRRPDCAIGSWVTENI